MSRAVYIRGHLHEGMNIKQLLCTHRNIHKTHISSRGVQDILRAETDNTNPLNVTQPPHTYVHTKLILTVYNTYNTLPPHIDTQFPFRRHKPWCAAHLWPNPRASLVQSATYGESNCLSAAWMSNQTRGVSARIFFPTFHVCSVLFFAQSLQNGIGTLFLK